MRRVLECQNCGEELRELSMVEAQKVALYPERFIVFCGPCGRDEMERLRAEEAAEH